MYIPLSNIFHFYHRPCLYHSMIVFLHCVPVKHTCIDTAYAYNTHQYSDCKLRPHTSYSHVGTMCAHTFIMQQDIIIMNTPLDMMCTILHVCYS